MTQNKLLIPLLGVATAVVLLISAYIFGIGQSPAFGSTPSEASDYQASSTALSALYGGASGGGVIKSAAGSFGSVIITGANTAVWNVYDATTSNNNLRTVSVASSTILIASFPTALVAGTYTFDVGFKRGLLVDVISGSMPTSTITYR